MEKAFDSLDHQFLIAALKSMVLDPHLFSGSRHCDMGKKAALLTNNGHSTGHFQLSRGSRQGDPLSAYWSVGPRRPSDQSDAIVAGYLYM